MLVCKIGDLHHGEKANSHKFNQQLLALTDFAIAESKKRGCTTYLQLGDYFDNRTKLDVSTIDYAIQNAQKIAEYFTERYTLIANHDIYYQDRLTVSSTKILEPYMTVIKEPTILFGNTLVAPWIVDGKAWDDFIEKTHQDCVRFAVGHFELNGFLVNDRYEMEHGYSAKELAHLELVTSGHYHGPQRQGNIQYVGSALPITMNEANEDHGIYFFDTDTGDLEFVPYTTVKVISCDYRNVEDVIDGCDPENTTIRVEFPSDLEDVTLIKTVTDFLDERGFKDRKIRYDDQRTKEILEVDADEVKEVENIDAVVAASIKESVDIAGVDKNLLSELYEEAKLKGDK